MSKQNWVAKYPDDDKYCVHILYPM